MDVEILKETLLEVLNVQTKAVSGKSNIPVLSNVLLKTDGEKLALYTTNLEMYIISWIGATISKPGSTTVSIKRFVEYINTLPTGTISLQYNGNELHVSSRNSNAVFNTIPSEEFPKVPVIKEDPVCSIDSTIFFDAISAVAYGASKDDTRPTFTGIYIEIGPSSVTFVAIDGFRLASKEIHVETGLAHPLSFIVPSIYAEDIAKLQSSKDEDVKLYILGNKNQLGIRYKNSNFVIRLIEGAYPDYKRVIPHEFTTDVVVSRQTFLDAVKTATIFSSQKEIGKIQLRIENDHIILRSSQKEIGENETKLDSLVKGETGVITFNARYLMDAVTHLEKEEILIKLLLKQDKPSVFYNASKSKKDPFAYEEGYFSLMTPIKVENE